jgi:hypothetical protein
MIIGDYFFKHLSILISNKQRKGVFKKAAISSFVRFVVYGTVFLLGG